MVRATLDSFSAHIALVDASGEIVLTNGTWRRFARANGTPPNEVSEGINYLKVCDSAGRAGSEEAPTFAEGLRAVLDGRLEEVRHRVPVPLCDRGCQSDLSDSFWREIPRSSRTAPRQGPGPAPRPDRLQPVLCGPGILRAPVPYRKERLKSLAGRFPGRQPHRWLVAYCRG
jgi:hypothetical protein